MNMSMSVLRIFCVLLSSVSAWVDGSQQATTLSGQWLWMVAALPLLAKCAGIQWASQALCPAFPQAERLLGPRHGLLWRIRVDLP